MEAGWNGLFSVVTARHCKRAYLDRPVPEALLTDVLRAAAHAPSTRNGQPWRVAVVRGAARDALAAVLCAEFDRGVESAPDYKNRPPVPDPVAEQRAAEAGAGVLNARGVARHDAEARRAHLRDNLRFYGAPVELILHLPMGAPHGMFLEVGLFLQNVMLGLVACGLGSCPQFSVAGYAGAIRAQLGLGADRLIVCGLAVGYPDEAVPVNQFAPPRAPVEDYVTWHDHATRPVTTRE